MNLDTNNAQTQAVIDHARTLVAGQGRPDVNKVEYALGNRHHETHSLSYLSEIAEAVCKEQKELFEVEYEKLSTHKNRYFIDGWGEDGHEEVTLEEYNKTYGEEEYVEHHSVFANGVNQTCYTKIVE